MFTNIKPLAYIRPVQCIVQILNGRKSPTKDFGLVIIKPPRENIIIPLWPSYYIPQNLQKITSRTALKHYNEFINVITEALRWVQMTIDTGIKFKVETSDKERYQQLLEFVTIDIIKLGQKHPSSKYIINLPMNKIINRSFNKHPMSWELIHRCLLHPSYVVMKEMCRNKTLDVLPKYFPKKIHKAPYKICFTVKTTTINKGTTVYTTNLQPGELVHI